MAGESAAIRRLQSGVPLPPAELLETERLLADHLRRHGDSRPVQAALDDVRGRIERTDARKAVAAEQAAARAEAVAGAQRVGGTVRREAFGGVRFDGDLRPPGSGSRRRTGPVLLVAAVAASIGVVVLANRGDELTTTGASDTSAPADAPAGTPAGEISGSADNGAAAGGPLRVSRSEFESSGRSWPLTVDAGTISCEGVSSVVFTADGGGSYAVNGTAMTHTSWPNVDAVWADDLGQAGVKVNIGDLIDAGLALCP